MVAMFTRPFASHCEHGDEVSGELMNWVSLNF